MYDLLSWYSSGSFMPSIPHRRQVLTLALAVMITLSLLPGVASAQSDIGGTAVVESDETVSSISGIYGTIIIEGTVTGDVSGLAGDVVVRDGGVIEGDLESAAGNVRIAGTVEGDVSVGAGSVHLTDTGIVERNFEVGAGEIRIDGQINGDAAVGADTIRLGDAAAIAGSLTYDGDLQGNTDAVAGEITQDRTLGPDQFTELQPFATWVFAINAFILNLLLGVLLLGLFPRFSGSVADRVVDSPIKTGLIGLGAFIGIPVFFILVAVTIVGIPISLVGLFAFLIVAWIGLVYGRFAVGYWLLSLAGIDNQWAGLIVGLILGALLWQVPYIGGLLNFITFLLGIGALIATVVTRRRRLGTEPERAPPEPAPAD